MTLPNNLNPFQRRAQQYRSGQELVAPPYLPDSLIEEDEVEPSPTLSFKARANEYHTNPKAKDLSSSDYFRDIAEQVIKKGIAGATGSYGNFLDAFGLQVKPGDQLPAQQQINSIQSGILEKMNQGVPLSFNELVLLSDDPELPNLLRLPTSNEIGQGIETLTGVGEGKTQPGRVLGRGAEMLAEGAAFGGGLKQLLSLGTGGLAGQSVRESGGPELLASALEIGSGLAPSVVSKTVAPLGKTAKDTANAGRKIGLTESQITPLIQSEGKISTIAPFARKSEKTKKLFSEIKQKLGDTYDSLKANPIAKKKLSIAEQDDIAHKFADIKSNLSKTLAPSPDKEAAIEYINKSLASLNNKDITPEYLINFWQDINKSVKWNSIDGGKKALAKLKEPIYNALKKVAPELAEDFELTNQLYSKYARISKKLKPDMIDSLINKGEILAAGPAALALVQGHPMALAGLATSEALRILTREMLINPYFQNIGSKLVTNFNSGSVKAIESTVKQVKEYMQRKHPNENWDFLTEGDTY